MGPDVLVHAQTPHSVKTAGSAILARITGATAFHTVCQATPSIDARAETATSWEES